VILLGVLTWVFKNSPSAPGSALYTPEKVEAFGGNTQVISELMFSEYLLPFELTSVLLLTAIIGAVAIAKRRPNHARPVTGKGVQP
jgi:NADH:ubiquinone oxidoreductase subunit 6 (subunit J)